MTGEIAALKGVQVVQGRSRPDTRGTFTRVADLGELRDLGMRAERAQLSYATNHRVGTIRGMHFQVEPHAETKLIWCVSGAVFDVLLDVRAESPTYGKWVAFQLAVDDAVSLLVPPGIAHGYQCLTDDSTVCYLIDGQYRPEGARSVKWDDPTVGIRWPLAATSVSVQDEMAAAWPPES